MDWNTSPVNSVPPLDLFESDLGEDSSDTIVSDSHGTKVVCDIIGYDSQDVRKVGELEEKDDLNVSLKEKNDSTGPATDRHDAVCQLGNREVLLCANEGMISDPKGDVQTETSSQSEYLKMSPKRIGKSLMEQKGDDFSLGPTLTARETGSVDVTKTMKITSRYDDLTMNQVESSEDQSKRDECNILLEKTYQRPIAKENDDKTTDHGKCILKEQKHLSSVGSGKGIVLNVPQLSSLNKKLESKINNDNSDTKSKNNDAYTSNSFMKSSARDSENRLKTQSGQRRSNSGKKVKKLSTKKGGKTKRKSDGSTHSDTNISEAASLVVKKIGTYKKKNRPTKKSLKCCKSVKSIKEKKKLLTQNETTIESQNKEYVDDTNVLSPTSQQQCSTKDTAQAEPDRGESTEKRSITDQGLQGEVIVTKKKRGRPKKVTLVTSPPVEIAKIDRKYLSSNKSPEIIATSAVAISGTVLTDKTKQRSEGLKKKRGKSPKTAASHPKKKNVSEIMFTELFNENLSTACTPDAKSKQGEVIKKKRGRPPKIRKPETVGTVTLAGSTNEALNTDKTTANILQTEKRKEIRSEMQSHGPKDMHKKKRRKSPDYEAETGSEDSEYVPQSKRTKKGTARKKLGRPRKYEFYECKKCDYRAKERSHLRLHEKAHIREPYKCRFCDFTTRLNQHYLEHEAKHTNTKPFKCEKCSYQSRYKADLYHHKSKHATEKAHKCPHCDFVTKWRRNISHHILTHTTDRPHKCDLCGFTFKRLQDLKYHLYRHSDQKPLICEECNFRCKTNFEMKCHKLKHSDVRYFKCTFPGCEQATKTKSDLTKHMKVHSSEKKFKCPLCGKGFKTYSCMSKHQQRHSDERPFLCDICQKSFKLKSSLRNHIRLHSGIKPHTCDVCGKDFANKSNMKIHMKTHSEVDRPFKCPICIYGAKTGAHLLAHIGSMHGNSHAYFCELCKKPFKRYGQLQIHYKRMHLEHELEAIGVPGHFDLHAIKKELKVELKVENEGDTSSSSVEFDLRQIKQEYDTNSSEQDTNVLETSVAKDLAEEHPSIIQETVSTNDAIKLADPNESSKYVVQGAEDQATDTDDTIETCEEANQSSFAVKQCNDTAAATLAFYDDFRLPIATKGFEFNFDKTGKKPKSWFMDPDNMVTEEAAAKQRIYLAKQQRFLNRESRHYYRKQKARLSKKYVHKNIKIASATQKKVYRRTQLEMFNKKNISRAIMKHNQSFAPMKKGKLEVFSEKVIENVKPVVTNYGFMTKMKMGSADIKPETDEKFVSSDVLPSNRISDSTTLSTELQCSTKNNVRKRGPGRPPKNKGKVNQKQKVKNQKITNITNVQLENDTDAKLEMNGSQSQDLPDMVTVMAKKYPKTKSKKVKKLRKRQQFIVETNPVSLKSTIKRKPGRPRKYPLDQNVNQCVETIIVAEEALSDSSDDVCLSVLANKLAKKQKKVHKSKVARTVGENVISATVNAQLKSNSNKHLIKPGEGGRKPKSINKIKTYKLRNPDGSKKSSILPKIMYLDEQKGKSKDKSKKIKTVKSKTTDKRNKRVVDKAKDRMSKKVKKNSVQIKIKIPQRNIYRASSSMQTQVQVVRRRKKQKSIPEFETLGQLVDEQELAPRVLQPFVKLEPIEGVEFVSSGSVYVPMIGDGVVLPSVCDSRGHVFKLEISPDMVINEYSKVNVSNTDISKITSNRHLLDVVASDALQTRTHYHGDLVGSVDPNNYESDVLTDDMDTKPGMYDDHKEAWEIEKDQNTDLHPQDDLPLDLTSVPEHSVIQRSCITITENENPLDLSLNPYIEPPPVASNFIKVEGPLDLSKSATPSADSSSPIADTGSPQSHLGDLIFIKEEPDDNPY